MTWGRRRCGCWRPPGSGGPRLSRVGPAVTLAVPRPGHRCLWGAFSADIPESAPGRRGCRRRAAGYGPEKDSAVTAAPGAPAYRGRPQRPRGRRRAVRGRPDRGRRRAVRGRPIGGGAQPGSAAIRVTGPGAGWAKYGRLSPGPRELPSPASAFPGVCLPRCLPSPASAFPGVSLPRRLPFPGQLPPGRELRPRQAGPAGPRRTSGPGCPSTPRGASRHPGPAG